MSLDTSTKTNLAAELLAFRRHLHAHPELSFEEHATSAYICEKLAEAGMDYRAGIAGTGIVVDLQGNGPGPVVALRADMDALPIHEQNQVEYRSQNEGVMHACGHDVHSTCLFGALRLLQERKEEWSGTVRGIFQPGEEKLPGGAGMMIREGVLKDPKVESIMALHVFPDLPVGHLGFRPGMYMASADEIHLRIIGKGGHAAMPHKCIDPIWIAAQLITGLQSIVSRKAPPNVPCVLSFGHIEAFGATNVIPNELTLKGTFRTLDEEWRQKAHEAIRDHVHSFCQAQGAKAELDIMVGYPFLKNDEVLTTRMSQAAKELHGAAQVHALPIRLTGEDFAFYSQKIPACFLRLGTAGRDGSHRIGVHHPKFDIDEGALMVGAETMAHLAMKELQFLSE